MHAAYLHAAPPPLTHAHKHMAACPHAPPPAQMRALVGRLGDARPALHALTLGFTHPATGERMQFSSELEPAMRALLQGLRDMA